MTIPANAPAPLYTDPVFDGPTDPTLVYDPEGAKWHLFYTQRRANQPDGGVAWVHGTDIGHAVSSDGHEWTYTGIQVIPDIESGNTWWAPEIMIHNGVWHMYVTYLEGVREDWSGPAEIRHYTSNDLEQWKYESTLDLDSERAIDATVHRTPDGKWRMWYKDERRESHIYTADSDDLFHWETAGPAATDQGQEGPTVFELGGVYWMVTDGWSGLLVRRSTDLRSWHRQPMPLLSGPGKRAFDEAIGHHAMALPQGLDEGYLYYFTHPGGGRRSTVQVARLHVRDGWLRCDRDEPFPYGPDPSRTPAFRGGSA
ncbi:family 43 glycosylhydrolase [Glycomyces buryatensis]|uniref:Glycosyl hydrolase n=1 Tax=Glycomyces buryatensis TaxID=2570927 RepID=A0A4S8QBF0_9ACTN|nr:family 43 glycosylhydrolase [Glycomyces buryatensis]THV37744.1 glycosyl hydrolase [Glycomyces buryatensis]